MIALGADVTYRRRPMVIVGRVTIDGTAVYTLEDENGEKYYNVSEREIAESNDGDEDYGWCHEC